MEWRQLEHFQLVARLEHVTRAAEQLGIPQPSLSRSIRRLERELGVPLFHQVGRSVRLSSYGRVFLESVERALDAIREGRESVVAMAGSEHGTIALGVLRSLAPQFAPALMRRFSGDHPDVRFSLTEDNRERLVAHLESGSVNLCLTVRIDHPRIVWRPIGEQELVLIVPRSHRLAQRASVHLSEVADERFISFKRGYPARTRTEELCRDAGFEPTIIAESAESSFVRGSVAAGSGIAIIPRSGETGAVAELRIEQPGASREIGIASIPGRFLSEAERLFYRFVIDGSSRHAGAG